MTAGVAEDICAVNVSPSKVKFDSPCIVFAPDAVMILLSAPSVIGIEVKFVPDPTKLVAVTTPVTLIPVEFAVTADPTTIPVEFAVTVDPTTI